MHRSQHSQHSMLVLTVLAAAATAEAAAASAASPGLGFYGWHESTAQAVYPGPYGAEAAANLTAFRSTLLSRVWRSFDPDVNFAEGYKRYDPMNPFISCPPNTPLKRYGKDGDGGKLLCSLDSLHPPCLIYSLGSNGDYSFEQAVINHTKCEVHTFDCTYQGKSIHVRHVYHKMCVGAAGANFASWDELTRRLQHHRRMIDVLKVDIEGHEPGVLGDIHSLSTLPRQIVIEMHMRPVDRDAITMLSQPTPRTPAQMALIFMHMASLGYGVVGREDNPGGEVGCCAEFTFLHVERQKMISSIGRGGGLAIGSSRRRRHWAGWGKQYEANLAGNQDDA